MVICPPCPPTEAPPIKLTEPPWPLVVAPAAITTRPEFSRAAPVSIFDSPLAPTAAPVDTRIEPLNSPEIPVSTLNCPERPVVDLPVRRSTEPPDADALDPPRIDTWPPTPEFAAPTFNDIEPAPVLPAPVESDSLPLEPICESPVCKARFPVSLAEIPLDMLIFPLLPVTDPDPLEM